MSERGISLKEALKKWEEKHKQKASEATVIHLYGHIPSIEKLDASASTLVKCEKLSLSTNCIEKLSNLVGLKNLRILSIGRNRIKSLSGIEALSESLEELWASYNQIDKLKGIEALKKLKVLYVSNNRIKEWSEILKLAELPYLEHIVLVGNPLEQQLSRTDEWRSKMARTLRPALKILDGKALGRTEED
ncbi:dynein axonemal light chain 1-like [Centruroides vittatus]|uniref:dynein axonemal light chain 1-like n=1 Tax=Centruroides vittatus TaxID=120091 RepID=UPI00350EC246